MELSQQRDWLGLNFAFPTQLDKQHTDSQEASSRARPFSDNSKEEGGCSKEETW